MDVNKAYETYFRDEEHRFCVLWGGAGSSKSYTIAQKLITKCVSQTYFKCIVLRKNYVSLKDSCFALLKKVIAHAGLEQEFKVTMSPLHIVHIATGKEFIFRGMLNDDDREKVKSIVDPSDAWMEEANEFDWDDFVQLRLRLRGGENTYCKQLHLSLNGVDEEVWVNKKIVSDPDFKTRAIILNTTYRDNKFLDTEYILELESLIKEDENYYNIYTLGKWGVVDYRGKIYKRYSDVYNLCRYKYNPMLPIIVCCDFNVDPMKWALIQNVNGIDYIFDEIINVDTDTESQTKELIERYGDKRTQYIIYGDYSGTFRHTSSRTTDYEIMEQYLPNADYTNISPNPYTTNRIDAVNWRLCNKENKRRLLIDEKCINARYDFKHAKYVKGKREEDKKDEKYDGKNPLLSLIHITSAIGYYIENKYSLKGQTRIKHGKFI